MKKILTATMQVFASKLLVACAVIVGVLLSAVFFFEPWIYRGSESASSAVRPAVRAVLSACLWSRLSGGYWESEMLRQSKLTANLPLQARLDFYREILLHCKVEASRGLLFLEVIGNDVEPMHQGLLTLRESSRFKDLSADQRKDVDAWADELGAIGADRKPVRR
jgi:hypothetical protein